MNWDAIGAVGEIVGALAVVLTLAYLALQVRTARKATIDQNTLARASGVREMMLTVVENDELRMNFIRDSGVEPHYDQLARSLGVSVEEASRLEWHNSLWFWLPWGQWTATHDEKGLKELKHLIASFYSNPSIRKSWDSSPWGKPILDPEFVRFVDEILAKVSSGND